MESLPGQVSDVNTSKEMTVVLPGNTSVTKFNNSPSNAEVKDLTTSNSSLRKLTHQGLREEADASRASFQSRKGKNVSRSLKESARDAEKRTKEFNLIDFPDDDEGTLRWKVRRLVNHLYFQLSVALVIVLNGVAIGIETDMDARKIEVNMYPFEIMFTIFYFSELSARFYVDGVPILKDAAFLFDSFLVALSLVDILVLSAMAESSSLSSFTLLRMLRIFKVVRILRIFRLLRDLWLLIHSIKDSIRLMMWYGIVLLGVIYICAIFSTQMVTNGLEDRNWPDPEDEEFVRDYFGSLDRTMLTLFGCIGGGDFLEHARRVIKGMPMMWIFFVGYTLLAQITILNVIVAIIVENTLRQTMVENEREKMMKMQRESEECSKRLQKLFIQSDTSGDGMVSRSEWLDALNTEAVLTVLAQMGLNKDHGIGIFDSLDIDHSESLNASEFVDGIMSGSNPCRVYDVMSVTSDLMRTRHTLNVRLSNLESSLEEHKKNVSYGISEILRRLPEDKVGPPMQLSGLPTPSFPPPSLQTMLANE